MLAVRMKSNGKAKLRLNLAPLLRHPGPTTGKIWNKVSNAPVAAGPGALRRRSA